MDYGNNRAPSPEVRRDFRSAAAVASHGSQHGGGLVAQDTLADQSSLRHFRSAGALGVYAAAGTGEPRAEKWSVRMARVADPADRIPKKRLSLRAHDPLESIHAFFQTIHPLLKMP